jgi:hypothetical protein
MKKPACSQACAAVVRRGIPTEARWLLELTDLDYADDIA